MKNTWQIIKKSSYPLAFINMTQKAGQVFKKSSPNEKLSLYLGKRDFVDHVNTVDPVDGVLLIDPEYLKDRKVYVILTCAFRYGREDLDVMGLSFRKDIYSEAIQVYPPVPDNKRALTQLQERLAKKLGENCYPFFFEIPPNLPCSVTLQPGPEDHGKACGVDFEVKGFCADNLEEKIHKRNSVKLIIRKIRYAPEQSSVQPKAEMTRRFLMSDKPLQLEASLDKEMFYHGEPIEVTVCITNNTSKVVKKIKLSVDQVTDVVLYQLDKYAKTVCSEEPNDTVAANSTFTKVYSLTPTLANNRQKRCLALDGKLKHEDTNLASSTILRPELDKEVLGILVSYLLKVKMIISRGGILGDLTSSEMAVEIPFYLMHPKPSEVNASAEDIVIEEFNRQKIDREKGDDEDEEKAGRIDRLASVRREQIKEEDMTRDGRQAIKTIGSETTEKIDTMPKKETLGGVTKSFVKEV
ncbi:arrestin-C-like [Heptranchias perlo]|uniref:arrestin-C-like n=1 Tax=Heptranchias perlo TaxID=212740 RepID=UPI0035594FAF